MTHSPSYRLDSQLSQQTGEQASVASADQFAFARSSAKTRAQLAQLNRLLLYFHWICSG